MDESRKQIPKEAMAIEMTGREFYPVTAEKTSDDKGRETFKFLTTEEEKHFHLLQTWLLKGFLTRIRSSDRGKAFRDVCHKYWRLVGEELTGVLCESSPRYFRPD
jgi:rubrerythrin